MSCNQCSKVFADSLALKRHLSIKHFDYSPYLCKICKKMGQLVYTAIEEDMDRHFEIVHPGTEQHIILSKKKNIDDKINAVIEESVLQRGTGRDKASKCDDFKKALRQIYDVLSDDKTVGASVNESESFSFDVKQESSSNKASENGTAYQNDDYCRNIILQREANVDLSERTQESPLNSEGRNNQAMPAMESNLSNDDDPIFTLPELKSFEGLPITLAASTRSKLFSITVVDKDLHEIDSIEPAIQTPLQNSSNNSDAKLIQRKRTLPQNYRDIRTEPRSKRSNPKKANGTEKRHKCNHCTYASVSKTNLYNHVRTHTGEKPFKCGHCSYACAVKNALDIHLRTHTGVRPFKCDKCSYASTQSGRLKEHMRIHTREKPFKCSYCSHACTRRDNLNKHIRTHTGEKPYKCSKCLYAGNESGQLKQHIRYNHSMEME